MTAPDLTPRLGCATTYSAQIYYWDRALQAIRYYTTLTGIMSLTWERTLDDYSEARLTFRPGGGDDCCGKLRPQFNAAGELTEPGLWPWAHELAIFRDGDLVWQGPVFSIDELVQADETTEKIQIVARDFLGWLDRRTIHQDIFLTDREYDLAEQAEAIIRDAFEPDDPGVLDHLVISNIGKASKRSIRRWEAKSSEELREIARAGLDYTSVGRAIIVKSSSHNPAVPTITLRAKDFLSGVEIRVVGAEAATVGVAVGGPPPDADPNIPPENIPPQKVYYPLTGGISPFFGLVENWTVSEGVTNESFLLWVAQQKVFDGNPPPTTLSLPADSSLSPEAPVSIHQLVPSTYFTINVNGTCRSVTQYMRLSHLRVTWSTDGPETVGVTFIPHRLLEIEEEP